MTVLSDATRKRITSLAELYPERRTALLPALKIAQEDVGYLPAEAIAEAADAVGVPHSAAFELAAFYTMLRTERSAPTRIVVCGQLPCALRGAEGLIRDLLNGLDWVLTNNIQVTLLAFAFGLTAGIGTAFLLIFNGVQLGAVAGWMTAKGNSSALWGWIMPHGGTELLAITLSGAAGFMFAQAIIAPGNVRRPAALRRVAIPALTIELGVMVMLVFAGMIEGFVSPSSIGFSARIGVLAVSMIF